MLLHRPTKLFLIPVVSIRTTSVVSVMLLCNKLVPKRFHFSTSRLARSSKTPFPRHRSGNARSISEKELKTPDCKAQGSACGRLAGSRVLRCVATSATGNTAPLSYNPWHVVHPGRRA